MSRICLVHYHEIGLKGRNRLSFERRLLDNLKMALAAFGAPDIKRISGHLLVTVEDESLLNRIGFAIAQVPGVVRVSFGWKTSRILEDIYAAARRALEDNDGFETFKVAARRSNSDFPISSMEMNRLVGEQLCEYAPTKKVRMKDPDVTVHVQVVQGSTYVFSRSILGVGGLPVGSAGRVVCLLSAGIDSPVATWRLIHRGAVAICVHFSGRPQTSDSSEYLVREIAEKLAPCGGIARLYLIPFGDYQREISLICPPALRVIMYRRLMFAVAQRIAFSEKAGALVTGESLGQVASQTLANIRATDDAVELPVFRPLIGSDKQEIIARAQQLDTFETSIRNQSDCCTLFMPRNPETHAKLGEVRDAWSKLPLETWVDEIIAGATIVDYPCAATFLRARVVSVD